MCKSGFEGKHFYIGSGFNYFILFCTFVAYE